MNLKRVLMAFILVFVTILGLSSCTSKEKESSSKVSKQEEYLTVYSGAGLKKPMEEIAKSFKDETGIKIEYIFAGSGELISQLETSGKGDVFIVGSKPTYDAAKKKNMVGDSKEVAYHTPAIIVKKGNPKGIKTLKDFEKDGVKVLLGDAKANAIGKTAQGIIEKNKLTGINKNVVARLATVSEIVVQIAEGTADAAIATKDSVFGNDKIEIIDIPESQNIDQILPIGTVTSSKKKDIADKFVSYVSSDKGKAIFEKFGFKSVK